MPDDTQRVVDLPSKTSSQISLANDLIMGIDSADGYTMLISDLAKAIIEQYTGSTLAGSAQSLKSAIDPLTTYGNNNFVTDANDATEIGKLFAANNDTANMPLVGYWVIWNRSYSPTYRVQYAQLINTQYPRVYCRSTIQDGWGDWEKIIDMRSVTISAASGSGISAIPSVIEGNRMATIEFALQIPAGTYENTMWTVNIAPSATIHFIAFVGQTARIFRLSSAGTISPNSSFTIDSASWMIGHVTYPFA